MRVVFASSVIVVLICCGRGGLGQVELPPIGVGELYNYRTPKTNTRKVVLLLPKSFTPSPMSSPTPTPRSPSWARSWRPPTPPGSSTATSGSGCRWTSPPCQRVSGYFIGIETLTVPKSTDLDRSRITAGTKVVISMATCKKTHAIAANYAAKDILHLAVTSEVHLTVPVEDRTLTHDLSQPPAASAPCTRPP